MLPKHLDEKVAKLHLEKIGVDLASIQDKVTTFKDENNITGLTREGELALESVLKNNEQLIQFNTQLSLAKWVKESLQKSNLDVLPENLGFSDANISSSLLYSIFSKKFLSRVRSPLFRNVN